MTDERDDIAEIEQAQGEYNGEKVHLDGAPRDPALDALDLDNITFDVNVDAQFSYGEEFDGDQHCDEDDDGEDDVIRGLGIET